MTESVGIRLFGLSLDEISKIIGGSIVAIYFLGYLVLSFYFSQYGFSQTNPLRPRVLEAGVCCLIFTVVPLSLGLVIDFIPDRNLSATKLIMLKLGMLPILGDYLTSLPGFTAGIDYSNPTQVFATKVTGVTIPVLFGLAIVGLFVFVPLLFWIWSYYHKHTVAVIIVIWSISFFLLRMHWHTRQLPSAHLFFGFCGLALLSPLGSLFVRTVQHPNAKFRPRFTKNDDSHVSFSQLKTSRNFFRPISSITSIMLIIFVFVTWVYGVIPFRLGGGHPIAVVLTLKHAENQR